MNFLLHYTSEGRIGICPETCASELTPADIIAEMPFEHVVGLYDDIHESFVTVTNNFENEEDD